MEACSPIAVPVSSMLLPGINILRVSTNMPLYFLLIHVPQDLNWASPQYVLQDVNTLGDLKALWWKEEKDGGVFVTLQKMLRKAAVNVLPADEQRKYVYSVTEVIHSTRELERAYIHKANYTHTGRSSERNTGQSKSRRAINLHISKYQRYRKHADG